MTHDPATRRSLIAVRAAAGVALAGFALYLASRYCLRPLSDPANWWHYARDLASDFPASKWPAAYPAFLWFVRRVAGEAAALLSNLPLLVALLASVGLLAREVAGSGRAAAAAGVFAMAALIAAAGPTLLDTVSPYRDPLALLLQVGSMSLFVRGLREAQPAGSASVGRRSPNASPASPSAPARACAPGAAVFASGLLLGLATAVREPSILTVLPMGLYACVLLRRAGWRSGWAGAWRGGLGLLLGLLPLLVQTHLATRQVLLPPQSVAEGHLVPGMEVSLAARTFGRACAFYRGDAWFFALALLGVGRAVRRRNPAVLALVLPSAVVFAAFYMCYWIFVPRYFLAAFLPAAVLAGYGVDGVAAALRSRPRLRPAAPALPLLAVAAALAWLWRPVPADSPARFRLADLHALTAQLASAVPPGSSVYAPRPLSDVIGFASPASSHPFTGERRAASEELDEVAQRAVLRRLTEGSAVFVADSEPPGSPGLDAVLAARHFALSAAGSLDPRSLHLLEWLPDRSVKLYRVEARTALSVTSSVPVAAGCDAPVLCAAIAGPAVHSDLAVELNGTWFVARLAQGTHFVRLPRGAGTAAVRLSGTDPVGWGAPPRVVSTTGPLMMDFGPAAPYTCDGFLSDAFRPCDDPRVRELRSAGTIRLPPVWPRDVWLCASLLVNGFSADGVWPVLDAGTGDISRLRRPVAAARRYEPAVLWLPPGMHSNLYVRVLNAGGTRDRGIRLDGLTLQPMYPAVSTNIDIGTGDDMLSIMHGFYGPEVGPQGRSVRWSAPAAAVRFLLRRGEHPYRLAVRTYPEVRPADAPPEPRFTWNGRAADAACESGEWAAVIPPSAIDDGENRLDIVCRPWRPDGSGACGDGRELGMMVDTISLTPLTEGTR